MKGNLDQHIDDQLKTSFDAIQKKAPMHLWAQISEKMDVADAVNAALDEKIQRVHLEAPDQKAPAPMWAKIEAALEEATPIDAMIDEKIKAGFLSEAKTAPVFLWGAISEELSTPAVSIDAALDDKLKEGFLTAETKKTPSKVWYAVSRQLNIDKTWSRITKVLDKEPVVSDWSGRMLRFFAVAALLLFFLKTCTQEPYTLPNSDFAQQVNPSKEVNTRPIARVGGISETKLSRQKNLKSVHSNQNTTRLLEGANLSATNSKNLKEERLNSMPKHSSKNETKASVKDRMPIIRPPVEDRSSKNAKEEPVLVAAAAVPMEVEELEVLEASEEALITSILDTEISSERTKGGLERIAKDGNYIQNEDKQGLNTALLAALALDPLTVSHIVEPIKLLDEIALEKKIKTNKNLIEGKLEAGTFVVVNSTMLLNNETREGFDPNSLTTNYFGLAANYGLWASYQILPKGALVAEFSINADNRQAYGTYEKGVFYVKEWVMKYNRFSLGYKQELWQTGSDKFVQTKVVAQAGVYVGMLREAKLFYDGVLFFDKQSDYYQFDFGFKIALGQEILVDKFVFGYGIRSDIGAANIFKGNNQLNSKEDPTSIIHLGGYVLFGYRF